MPPRTLLPDARPRRSQVVHSGRVAVRASPSSEAKCVGAKAPGERVIGVEEVSGWVKLSGQSKGLAAGGEQWMKIDGTDVGLGRLLERMGLSDAFRGGPKAEDEEDEEEDEIEPWKRAPDSRRKPPAAAAATDGAEAAEGGSRPPAAARAHAPPKEPTPAVEVA